MEKTVIWSLRMLVLVHVLVYQQEQWSNGEYLNLENGFIAKRFLGFHIHCSSFNCLSSSCCLALWDHCFCICLAGEGDWGISDNVLFRMTVVCREIESCLHNSPLYRFLLVHFFYEDFISITSFQWGLYPAWDQNIEKSKDREIDYFLSSFSWWSVVFQIVLLNDLCLFTMCGSDCLALCHSHWLNDSFISVGISLFFFF